MGGIIVSNTTNPEFMRCTLVGRDPAVQGKGGKQFILTLQLKAGLTKGE